MFIKILAIGLPALVLLAVAFLAYHDFFRTPDLVEKEVGPFTIAVKRYVGSYSGVGPTMNEVDKYLRELGVKSSRGVGLYYDDPSQVKQSELRCDVGNMIGRLDEEILGKVKQKLEVKEIKKQKALVATFPIRSPLSYMLGPMKVYPLINKYFKEKGLPEYLKGEGYGMEIYDIPNKVTLYVMPLP